MTFNLTTLNLLVELVLKTHNSLLIFLKI